MGSTAKASLRSADQAHPARRLHVTPKHDVDALCVMALERYLEQQMPSSQRGAIHRLVCSGAGGDEAGLPELAQETWVLIHEHLHQIRVLDPACGEGHVLEGMLDLLDSVGDRAARALNLEESRAKRRHRIAQQNLFGVEAQEDVLWRARYRLRQACRETYPAAVSPHSLSHLQHGDSLVERGGFAWSRAFGETARDGGFHLIVGNPPYVRQEQIRDPLGQLPREEYKARALISLYQRLPEFFAWDSRHSRAALPLDGRSDLCLLFTLLGFSLLHPAGVLGFVLPTSLFSAQYGCILTRFLHATDRRSELIENLKIPSFPRAAVNTALFVAWKPCHGNTGNSCDGRARDANAGHHPDKVHRSQPPPSSSLAALVYRIDDLCTPMASFGRLRYPVKTGLNCFFYPSHQTCARFRIESDFLRAALKSPREVQRLVVRAGDARARLFHCPHSLSELQTRGASGALAYIAWGSRQMRSDLDGDGALVSWPEVPSLRGRDPWYEVVLPRPASIICPRFIDRRFLFALCEGAIVEDQTFYGLVPDDIWRIPPAVLAAVLNSTFTYLSLETHGRTGLGDGARQYALCDLAALPVLDARRLDPASHDELRAAFLRLAERPIMGLHEEMVSEERIALDTAVARGFGLQARDAAQAREVLPGLVDGRLARARRRRGLPD